MGRFTALTLVLGLGACTAQPTSSMDPIVEPVDPSVDPIFDPAWPPDEPIPAAFDFPPYANLVDATTVAVSWRTHGLTTGTVRFGRVADGDAGMAARSSTTDANVHHVMLSGLEAGTAYRYEVSVDGTTAKRRGMFVTPGREQWRLLHSGEFHAPSESANVLGFVDAIRAFRPHVVLESGDMVDDGNDLTHWRSYFRTASPWISNVLLLPAHSNHVNGAGGNANLRELFVLPNNERWYATRYGQAELLSIDSTYSNNTDIVTDELPWIEQTARAAHDGVDDPTFVVAAWHHPACSSQYRTRYTDREWVQTNLIGRLQAGGGVDLVLAGHDKYYERSMIADGILHVITNIGQVSPEIPGNDYETCTTMMTSRDRQSVALISFDGATLTGRAVDETGATLDVFELAK